MPPPRHAPYEAVFRPFADDAATQTVGGMSIENGTRGIALHGSLDITKDRAGLKRARALRAALDAIVTALEAADLPDEAAVTIEPARTVRNPFV